MSEDSVSKEDLNEAMQNMREEVNEATDPRVMQARAEEESKKSRDAEDRVMQRASDGLSDFKDVFTEEKYNKLKADNPDLVKDIQSVYGSGGKEEAYRMAYRAIKSAYPKPKEELKPPTDPAPTVEKKEEQPLPKRDLELAGLGSVSHGGGASVSDSDRFGVLGYKNPSVFSPKKSAEEKKYLSENMVRIPTNPYQRQNIYLDAKRKVQQYFRSSNRR